MDYSFYLFTKLHDVLYQSDAPYDEQFDYLEFRYEKYYKSKYNDPNKGEYECMVDFLKNNAPEEEEDYLSLCSLCNGTGEGPADGTTCTRCKGTGCDIN